MNSEKCLFLLLSFRRGRAAERSDGVKLPGLTIAKHHLFLFLFFFKPTTSVLIFLLLLLLRAS